MQDKLMLNVWKHLSQKEPLHSVPLTNFFLPVIFARSTFAARRPEGRLLNIGKRSRCKTHQRRSSGGTIVCKSAHTIDFVRRSAVSQSKDESLTAPASTIISLR